eukprot:TRINITY_DN3644_c0_g1_i2.p1 TRINITY_DN3644_c0_g1~~TRINITY_DN3644_c0_g1_i2.p1  ORF type:complete len:376 (-),score=16.20 TRINITY_DN3644_c0_g1_i2:17-1120(-)
MAQTSSKFLKGRSLGSNRPSDRWDSQHGNPNARARGEYRKQTAGGVLNPPARVPMKGTPDENNNELCGWEVAGDSEPAGVLPWCDRLSCGGSPSSLCTNQPDLAAEAVLQTLPKSALPCPLVPSYVVHLHSPEALSGPCSAELAVTAQRDGAYALAYNRLIEYHLDNVASVEPQYQDSCSHRLRDLQQELAELQYPVFGEVQQRLRNDRLAGTLAAIEAQLGLSKPSVYVRLQSPLATAVPSLPAEAQGGPLVLHKRGKCLCLTRLFAFADAKLAATLGVPSWSLIWWQGEQCNNARVRYLPISRVERGIPPAVISSSHASRFADRHSYQSFTVRSRASEFADLYLTASSILEADRWVAMLSSRQAA